MSQHDNQKREVRLAPDPKIDFVEGLKKAHAQERSDDAKARALERDDDRKHRVRELLLSGATVALLCITAAFTCWQGLSSARSASAASAAADAAGKALEQSLRSWLKPSLTWPDAKGKPQEALTFWKAHHDITVQFTFDNLGRMPITDAEIDLAVEIPRWDQAPLMTYAGSRHAARQISYPGDPFTIDAEYGGSSAGPGIRMALTPELEQDLLQFRRYLVAYGQGTYHDPLGEHWIRFCYNSHLGSPPAEHVRFAPGSACPQYNAAGDGPLPN